MNKSSITRCLSIRPPWAHLVVRAYKSIENRSWAPTEDVLGTRIAIHASSTASGFNDFEQWLQFKSAAIEPHSYGRMPELKKMMASLPKAFTKDNCPRSAIIGSVELVGFTDGVVDWTDSRLPKELDGYGKICPWLWAEQDVCWHFANPREYAEPIPCDGKLNLWRLSEELQAQVAAAEADI